MNVRLAVWFHGFKMGHVMRGGERERENARARERESFLGPFLPDSESLPFLFHPK